jgi:hypothetical protein
MYVVAVTLANHRDAEIVALSDKNTLAITVWKTCQVVYEHWNRGTLLIKDCELVRTAYRSARVESDSGISNEQA